MSTSAVVHAKTIIASGAKLQGDHKQISFAIALSKKVPIKVFTLAKPYRVVIDLPEVKFRFPAGLGRKGRGLVSAYRYGLFARGKSRIVIDAKVPVLVKQAYVRAGNGQQPAKMFIKLVKTTSSIFALNLTKRILMKELEPEEPKVLARKVAPVIPSTKKGQAATKTKRSDDKRPVIIIDPGHGGVDPGAIGSKGSLEKDVVLSFSRVLRKALIATGRYRVEMTRDTDIYIPLHGRVNYGRNKGGSLFISIHADSISRRRRRRHRVRGASVYILSESSSDEEAQALARLENRSDIIAGVELPESDNPVSSILIDLAQRETNALSLMFARLQIKQMRGKVRLHDTKTRSAGFRVLKAPDIPSILLELGYLSSKYDERNLKSSKWRRKMASAIVKAVRSFFNQRVARNPY
ncbi:MAG: N-acetylmuramoyl-L-alanine amidase [Hyphomicrobiaceae bacterium]|nr:N-acetylmuramoyl-L-alanine amidase [Hyphomicrobiaceae bacterium]